MSSASPAHPLLTSSSSQPAAKLIKTGLVLSSRAVSSVASNGVGEGELEGATVVETTTQLSPDSPQNREPDSSTGQAHLS